MSEKILGMVIIAYLAYSSVKHWTTAGPKTGKKTNKIHTNKAKNVNVCEQQINNNRKKNP